MHFHCIIDETKTVYNNDIIFRYWVMVYPIDASNEKHNFPCHNQRESAPHLSTRNHNHVPGNKILLSLQATLMWWKEVNMKLVSILSRVTSSVKTQLTAILSFPWQILTMSKLSTLELQTHEIAKNPQKKKNQETVATITIKQSDQKTKKPYQWD